VCNHVNFRAIRRLIEPHALGDVNGDGIISIADAIQILRFVAGLSSVIEPDNAAWNSALITGGDRPNVNDAVQILRYLVWLPNVLN
jgi:hypothetical protein